MKRLVFAFIAAYAFIFLWGWLLNGVFLKDVYAQTPNLWRSQSEMIGLFHWIIIGQALIVFSFVMIYASGFAGGRRDCGNPARCAAGNRSDRHAPWFLRRPTHSRKTDSLWQHRRSGRDGDRRGNGRRDLQTGPAAHGLTTTHLWANWTLSAGRSTFG